LPKRYGEAPKTGTIHNGPSAYALISAVSRLVPSGDTSSSANRGDIIGSRDGSPPLTVISAVQ
jgi:hypothetical protein